MKTSCFKYYTGDMGVSICLYPPYDWNGMQYLPLAPDVHMFYALKDGKITQEEYEKQYREKILAKLDPKEVYSKFKNFVLLCFEPPGQFCHRRIVAKWIEQNIGIEIPEWKPSDETKKSKNINPLF